MATVSAILAVSFAAPAEIVDRIVATVGNEVILQSELLQEIAPALSELRQTAADQEEFSRLAESRLEQALEQAIESKILLRQAMLAGLDINMDTVEDRIAEIKKRFPSEQAFEEELLAAGETMSDFRERVRKQMLAISMGMRKQREFEQGVEVAESDVAQYYEDHTEEFTHPARVRLRRIFLRAEAGERDRVRAQMAALGDQLEAGADFAELARAHSDGPDADEGGLVGWVARGDLLESLEKVAFSLAPGEVSEPLDTEYGVLLLKAEAREEAGTLSLDEARAQIEPKLRAERARERFEKWMSELRKRSRVQVFF